MRFDDVMAALGETEAAESVQEHWAESMLTLPARPAFLEEANIRDWSATAGLKADQAEILCATAREIAANDALFRFAWHTWRRMAQCPMLRTFKDWPTLTHVLGERGGTLYLLVALGLIPLVRVWHASLGVPEAVTDDTVRSFGSGTLAYATLHPGVPGITLRQFGWIRNFYEAPLFRLGRWQYWSKPFPGCVVVYRHRRTGRVAALAEDGLRYTGQGFVAYADEPEAWTASLTETADAVTGRIIHPAGFATGQTVTLKRAEWEFVFRRGDPVLQVHIPGGGGMGPDVVLDSMRRGLAFFDDRFPELKPRAIQCNSWIFNPQLEAALPVESNLVRVLRQCHLYPLNTEPNSGLWFLFLQDAFDSATAPRDTSLQRAVLDYLDAGHAWRGNGGMFLLPEQLDDFGAEPYRRDWPDVCKDLGLEATS